MAVAAMLPLLEDHHWHQQTAAYESRLFEEEFLRAGWHIGRDQTAGLMRAAGLQGVRRGRKPITTRPAGEPDARPDLVERRFAAERPHQLWVADITYVRILGGFCYVAFITDVFTRRIVGWAVSASLHTQGLPLLALEHALLSTGASRGREGLIHHSDRPAQYVFLVYSDARITAGVSASVGTVGDSYDNALASERERPLQGKSSSTPRGSGSPSRRSSRPRWGGCTGETPPPA